LGRISWHYFALGTRFHRSFTLSFDGIFTYLLLLL
jgi:hypothetical protein